MEFFVLVFMMLFAAVHSIIVDPSPLVYSIAGGYASGFTFPSTFTSHDPNLIYKYETPRNSVQKSSQQSKYSSGSQYAAAYPTVHHAAEFTFASPPVRHAEPINYPVPPAPVREEAKEPQRDEIPFYGDFKPQFGNTITYSAPATNQNGLLGVAFSPATHVSRMSFVNGYGVSYGY